MIILKHNNGIVIGEVPTIYVASLSVDTDIIFFETKEEYNNYMNEKYPNTDEYTPRRNIK